MNRTELLRLARLGAEARLNMVEHEIRSIVQQFPELKPRRTGARVGAPRSTAETNPREMSAAARRAISRAQRKRWAAWRKQRAKKGAG